MKPENNHFQQAEDILIKYLTGSASESEREFILNWINENPDHQKYFDELKAYYQLTKIVQKPSGFDKEEGWQKIRARYYKEKYLSGQEHRKTVLRKTVLYSVISSAAAVFIAFFLGYSAYNGSDIKNLSSSQIQNEIVVPLGAKSHVTLSDGTKVWLNAGSKLNYPAFFSQESREVYLEGEAFFDVQHNEKRMFIVKTSNLNIKVYGTQFNVKSYPEENLIQTTLVKGSVAIENRFDKANGETIFLKPNQTATYYKSSSSFQTNNNRDSKTKPPVASESDERIVVAPEVNPVPITSWKDNRWVIVSEELSQLAIKLERRYNVKISFADESLKRYKFSGTLRDETFEQVLRIIQLSAPITFQIDGNVVTFKEDPLYKKKYDKMISNTP
jgi:transmembrane sensor